jgi:biopolymer transport protein ExbD
MGMSAGGAKEINVTPLIDVLLVLLIIFLVMIPILAKMETVSLPPQVKDVQPQDPPITVKVQADLAISIDEGPPQASSELSSIRPRLGLSRHVFIDAEPTVPWNEVVQIVDRVRGLAAHPEAIEIAVRIREAEEP